MASTHTVKPIIADRATFQHIRDSPAISQLAIASHPSRDNTALFLALYNRGHTAVVNDNSTGATHADTMDATCIGTIYGSHVTTYHTVFHLYKSLPLGSTTQDTAHICQSYHLTAFVKRKILDEGRISVAVRVNMSCSCRCTIHISDEAYTNLAWIADNEIAYHMILPIETTIERNLLLTNNRIVINASHIYILCQTSLRTQILLGSIVCPPKHLLGSGYVQPSLFVRSYKCLVNITTFCAEPILIFVRRYSRLTRICINIYNIAKRFPITAIASRRLRINFLVITCSKRIRSLIRTDGLIEVFSSCHSTIQCISKCSTLHIAISIRRDAGILYECTCRRATPAVGSQQSLNVTTE